MFIKHAQPVSTKIKDTGSDLDIGHVYVEMIEFSQFSGNGSMF